MLDLKKWIKVILLPIRNIKKRHRKFILKSQAELISLSRIITDLSKIGITNGDVVLMHSSLKSIGYVQGGAKTVINGILKVIGNDGTLLLPTYPLKGSMLNTCLDKSYIFDVKKSPITLGAIPSSFLNFKGIHRSIHPTHSMTAYGKFSKQLTESHHLCGDAFGKCSPWAKLIHLKGKILGIGIDLGPTTQYHFVEDIMGGDFPVKVKVNESYYLRCKNYEKEVIMVRVNPLDPRVAETRIDLKKNFFIRNYFWEINEKLSLLNFGNIGNAKSWWVDARSFCNLIIILAKLGITIYSTKDELIERNLYPFEIIELKLQKMIGNEYLSKYLS